MIVIQLPTFLRRRCETHVGLSLSPSMLTNNLGFAWEERNGADEIDQKHQSHYQYSNNGTIISQEKSRTIEELHS